MMIAAFNVKQLGMKKVNNDVVLNNLTKIVSRYSILVMLEVKDQDGTAMREFLDKLNEVNEDYPYDMKCSTSVGRSSYKEKFVFFYRKDEVKVKNSFQYKETGEDVLAREPYVVRFRCRDTVVGDLALIPVHTKPADAEVELDALDNVVQAVRNRWDTDNIMILGDFNADGRYLSERKKNRISIFQPPYHWLIGDEVDTTTSNANDHTYDRIVVYGSHMFDAVVPDSAKPFNFQRAYRLSDKTAQQISDHYPVEVRLERERW